MKAIELINLLFPEHDRSSCADDNIQNGINNFDNHTRCSRCALLSLMEDNSKIELVKNSYISIELKCEEK